MKLSKALEAWATPDFERVFKREVRGIGVDGLPLQQGLSQTSHACEGDIDVLVINSAETAHGVHVKAGIFYSGLVTGSCCIDDPTPVEEQAEYCVVQFAIDKDTGETTATLVEGES